LHFASETEQSSAAREKDIIFVLHTDITDPLFHEGRSRKKVELKKK
jgi:hypothetical protein